MTETHYLELTQDQYNLLQKLAKEDRIRIESGQMVLSDEEKRLFYEVYVKLPPV